MDSQLLPDTPIPLSAPPRTGGFLAPAQAQLVYLGGKQSAPSFVTTLSYANQTVANVKVPDLQFNPHKGFNPLTAVEAAGSDVTESLSQPPLSTFNLITLEWTASRDLSLPALTDHSLTIIGDTAYVYGGLLNRTASADLWQVPLSQAAASVAGTRVNVRRNAPGARYNHCAGRLGNDSILVFSGQSSLTSGFNETQKPETHVFNVTNYSWQNVSSPNSPSARHSAACTTIGDDVYLFGGAQFSPNQLLNDIWRFSAGEMAWNRVVAYNLASQQPPPRVGAVIAPVGRFLVMSGDGADNDPSFYFFDLSSQWWIPTNGSSIEESLLSPSTSTSIVGTARPTPFVSSSSTIPVAPIAASVAAGVVAFAAIGTLVWRTRCLISKERALSDCTYHNDVPPPAYSVEEGSERVDEGFEEVGGPRYSVFENASLPLPPPFVALTTDTSISTLSAQSLATSAGDFKLFPRKPSPSSEPSAPPDDASASSSKSPRPRQCIEPSAPPEIVVDHEARSQAASYPRPPSPSEPS
ncbi:hypothetical protein BDK51DRAFT_49459 [Blyttiomyces helicus]|uniref:Galactose oxidase n=1 Tax=Blyttiomyces helicus TaxID=388810 RepID=A0A4P9W7U3_9FUNG|nr:hypothetical protein BDK51DRAFT_49459 [Blyttiomyces helicus]|eukprot:RKO87473.1 hypothetical protein BDK51DRAFT_49459 [Blyttiomyces helicus]